MDEKQFIIVSMKYWLITNIPISMLKFLFVSLNLHPGDE